MKILVTILLLVSLSMPSHAQDSVSAKNNLFIGYPQRIKELDSLIKASETLALQKTDYDSAFQYALNAGNASDSLIQIVANQFISHLVYGNSVPTLEYLGAKFNTNVYDIPALLKYYVQEKTITELCKYILKNNKQVSIILDSLHYYQNPKHANAEKLNLLAKAANEYRWLNIIKQKNRVIIVNIPSATLRAYDSNRLVMTMKVVVGKVLTQTNTLSSQVKQVVLNPYWHVPKSIIIKEMIPKYKADTNYFTKNNYAVLDEKGKEVILKKAHLSKYNITNFPYTVRQKTGLENSLGLLKIEFDSPSAIYLHDSPEKHLFENTNRFYSHGCVRLEKPIDIGKWLLKGNSKEIDSFDFAHPEKYPKPIYVPVINTTQVLIWYALVDFDKKNRLKFYKNIYNK